MSAHFSATEIKQRLQELTPEVPWAHHFELAPNVHTIEPGNEKFFKKSVGLGKVGEVILQLIPFHTKVGSPQSLRVLDIACGEGVHSIRLAQEGANVLGIEGRELYVERAQFAAKVFGLEDRVRFILEDVRQIDAKAYGHFDLVIVSGILHHLNHEAFFPFLQKVSELCSDTMFLYTHIATETSREKHRLQGPVLAQDTYEGYLFREHADDASDEERKIKVRASLDNTHSFWATEESLILALERAGFPQVFRSLRPHLFFNYENAAYRPIVIARKG